MRVPYLLEIFSCAGEITIISRIMARAMVKRMCGNFPVLGCARLSLHEHPSLAMTMSMGQHRKTHDERERIGSYPIIRSAKESLCPSGDTNFEFAK